MGMILFVADRMDTCERYAEELAFEGYTVILTARPANIQEAVHFSLPDLVLVDLYMKGEERWGLLRQIKDRNPYLPMLMVTACEINTGKRLAPAEGSISSQIYFNELRKKIREILEGTWASPLSAASSH